MLKRLLTGLAFALALVLSLHAPVSTAATRADNGPLFDHAQSVLQEGQNIFRFDSFGDELFWTGTLRLNEAIEGADLGGVGPGLSPRTALTLGLKVDIAALPLDLARGLQEGGPALDDPAVTLQLIRLNAVLGIKGMVVGQQLDSVGVTCALCHSTVDNSQTFGIGRRLDGFANRDLDIGQIISLAPDLSYLANLLGVSQDVVRQVLLSWGPGKFDAELTMDGKAFNPQQITDGQVTGTNVPGATLIPNAFAMPGHNEVTWTGGWGTVTYWNAFVSNLLMHGKGNFFDTRLDNATQYPIAAAHHFGHILRDPNSDQITSKLPALHVYQLLLAAPTPVPGVDYDPDAARRGDALFSGQGACTLCHDEPIWTEPGWNLHLPADIGIDGFQADRGPDLRYRTMNLAGIFVRERGLFMAPENKGRYYHDGRFATLLDVVNHYDVHFNLGLTDQQKSDIVEYMKSLGDPLQGGGVPLPQAPTGQIEARPAAEPASLLVSTLSTRRSPVTAFYRVREAGQVSIKVFDVGGRVVAELVNTRMAPGQYTATWDPGRSPSGVYFCRLQAGSHEESRKFVIAK